MSLKLTTSETTTRQLGGNVVQQTTRAKSELMVAVDIAKAAIQEANAATGNVSKLVKDLVEAEAALELMDKKFKMLHFEMAGETGKWLTEMRATNYALSTEFKGVSKTVADVAEYFNRADIKAALVQLREICELTERVAKLNADPATQKLIEALMAR